MTLSYKKLWKLLIDRELSKKELANLAGLSQYTINKLNRSETFTTGILLKICYALKCDIGDICHIVFEEEWNNIIRSGRFLWIINENSNY